MQAYAFIGERCAGDVHVAARTFLRGARRRATLKRRWRRMVRQTVAAFPAATFLAFYADRGDDAPLRAVWSRARRYIVVFASETDSS